MSKDIENNNINNDGKGKTPHLRNIRRDIDTVRRRKQVAQLLDRGDMNETEIADFLHCAISTVSRDIQWLKEQARSYVYDLAKEDLSYFYVSSIKNIDKARIEAWESYYKCNDQQRKDKVAFLKVIIQCNVERFNLLSAGPTVMSVKSLEAELKSLLEQDKKRVIQAQS